MCMVVSLFPDSEDHLEDISNSPKEIADIMRKKGIHGTYTYER